MIRRTLLTLGLSLTTLLSGSYAANGTHPHTPLIREKTAQKEDLDRFLKVLYTVHHYYIQNVSFRDLLQDAATGMLTHLDPHSQYLNKKNLSSLEESMDGHFVGIGVEITAKEGLIKVMNVMDGSPAKKAGLKPDDLIFKINNTLIRDSTISNAVKLIKGEEGTRVTLSVLRKNTKRPLTFKVKRKKINYTAVTLSEIEPGYVRIHIAIFQKGLRKKIKNGIKAIRKKHVVRGIILDVRNNPGGMLTQANDVTGLFLTKKQLTRYDGKTVSIKGRLKEENKVFTTKGSDFFKGTPVVVLINQASASASEIVAGALHDYHRAVIVGEKSFGKGSVQTIIPITRQTAIKLTTSLYYTPSGTEIQTHGVTPDVFVPNVSVQKSKQNRLDLSESNYGNHLSSKKTLSVSTKKEKGNPALAVDDYPLYEAWTVLKGIESLIQR